jgi:hypothetical protein
MPKIKLKANKLAHLYGYVWKTQKEAGKPDLVGHFK